MSPIEMLICMNLVIFDADYPTAPESLQIPKGCNGISEDNALIIKRELD